MKIEVAKKLNADGKLKLEIGAERAWLTRSAAQKLVEKIERAVQGSAPA